MFYSKILKTKKDLYCLAKRMDSINHLKNEDMQLHLYRFCYLI